MTDPIDELRQHERECARRYETFIERFNTNEKAIVRIEALLGRNTWLLGLVLAGMLAALGKAFWPLLG